MDYETLCSLCGSILFGARPCMLGFGAQPLLQNPQLCRCGLQLAGCQRLLVGPRSKDLNWDKLSSPSSGVIDWP